MSCPEPLERIFRQVEEESERRAQEAELASMHSATQLDQYVQEQTSNLRRPASETASREVKQSRRGSVSISRLGQYTPTTSGPPSPNATKHLSHSPFFQSQIAAANASSSSVASCGTYFESATPSTNDLNGAGHAGSYDAYTEDTSQVVQVYQIAPQQTMLSRLMPRRLSRARSSSVSGMIPPSNYQLELGGVGIGIGVGIEVKEEVEEVELTTEKSNDEVGEMKVLVDGGEGGELLPPPTRPPHSRRASVAVGLPTITPTLKTKTSRSGLNVFRGGRSRSGSVAFSVASAATNTNVSTTSSNASSKPDSPGPATPEMATAEPKTGFLAKVVDKFKKRSSRIEMRSEPSSPVTSTMPVSATSLRPPSPLSQVTTTGNLTQA
ncbi:hypothetical protein BKA70DRAFT_827956 [Coprinopsis sp. MPI-PUGE-AT-0042]|nr:hypothetical protein BKA70DRAFT_827956 [Coprinopsis sp. MPI-PUGE-AT-0042]